MANTSFAQLKKSRQSQLDRLTEEINKLASKSTIPQEDNSDLFWYPSVDKAGNGMAIIRFLPAPKGEDIPFVRVFSHAFQGPTGSWYINNSLTTIGKDDPVGQYNNQLWNTGAQADKDQARKQKRNLQYYTNVYIIKDSANPENEGKVKIFKFGKKIFDKLNEAMNPQFEDEKPMNPFDLWEGAPFKLKIRNVEGYRNYDKSEFGDVGPLFDDDDKMEEVWSSEHSLQQFIAPDKFKSWDELKAQLHRVLGGAASNTSKAAREEEDTPPWVEEKPKASKKPTKIESVDEGEDDLAALLKDL